MATKRLALELGLVQKRKLKNLIAKSSVAEQDFDYVVVLDFESTCWEAGARMSGQEIIEFPAVLLHLASGKIISEFHQYVMPVEQPVLSEFCTKLTGITQSQVEDGMPIGACLGQFTSWIRKLCDEHKISFNTSLPGKHVTFATWSDWDLGVCLHYECNRKHLKKPDFFNQWIDIKVTYKNFYQRRPQGLAGALKDLGISFEGREHSGICDTRNTAVLVSRMVKDGCALKITKSLSTKTKGNSVKEAAKKLFNQVKTAVLGKRTLERIPDEASHPKIARLKSTAATVPTQSVMVMINDNKGSDSIDFNLGLSGVVGEKTISVTGVHHDTINASILIESSQKEDTKERAQNKSVVSKFSRPFKVPIIPMKNILNTEQGKKGTFSTCNTPKLLSHEVKDSFRMPVIPSTSVARTAIGLRKPLGERGNVSCHNNVSSVSMESNRSYHLYKRTPPLCSCGRRAKLLCTSKPGPNEGRYFFACPNGSTDGKKGCKFFKWEDSPFVKTPLLTSFCTPVANLNQKFITRSLPHAQRTAVIKDLQVREVASEPLNMKKTRCIGLSRNIMSPSASQSKMNFTSSSAVKSVNGIANKNSFEITPFIVRHESKIK